MSEETAEKKTLPEWMRSKLSDSQRFMAMCVLVGLLCGLAAVAFHFSIEFVFDGLWEFATGQDPLLFAATMLFAPAFAGLLVGLAVHFYAPDCVGSGIPQTKAAYYNKGGKVKTSSGILRFILGTLYVGLGNSLGREGPTVHVSAAISSKIGRWAFKDAARRQSMTPVGMAAGIAAAFNAPLSALTFVFEELLHNFSMKAIGGMVVAVVMAAAVSRTILGENPALTTSIGEDYITSPWMLVALPLGLAAGLIGHLFVWSTLNLRLWFQKKRSIPAWINPAAGGFSCGMFGLAAFYITGELGNAQNSVFSIGYQSLEAAFGNNLSLGIIATLLVLKFLAVVVNYASGGSGGLFAPTLFLGGMLGGLVGLGLAELQHVLPWIPEFPSDAKVIGGCVLLGMGAMFGSVIRATFTSFFIIFEMTGNYSLILPLMAGNMIAIQIAKRLQPVTIYDALLLQQGITLRKLPGYSGAQDYRKLPVQTIMTHDVFPLRSYGTASDALKRILTEDKDFHAYPVLDEYSRMVGVLSMHELKGVPEETMLGSLCEGQEIVSVAPECSIRDAANTMIVGNLQQVPVVLKAEPEKLLGWLTLNDIARQQNAVEG